MIYLTFNDAPGGVYQSQVIDTCRFWQETFEEKVLLVAMISGRGFATNKKKIKSAWPNSIILPMYPGIAKWRKNESILKFALSFRKKHNIIARGVFATLLAKESGRYNQLCFDARGAYTAEWNEYLKDDAPVIADEMYNLEKEALECSDSQLAVSHKLVDYWKTSFNFSPKKYAIIPCTLSDDFVAENNSKKSVTIRQKLGVADNEILLVYSGSSAGWQSFKVLDEVISKAFSQNSLLKLLMLCKSGAEESLADKFPGRVIQQWVIETEVHQYLQAANYGLLVREDSITNQVSSPVKFAEYLAARLPVIISDNIGDFSAFVQDKKCGMLVSSIDWSNLKQPLAHESAAMQDIAKNYFRKKNYLEEYKKLF